MNIEAPTFYALDQRQKRALILRDQLRFVDPQHLNEFLEGVSSDEPPTYTKINGIIKPELAFVTPKEDATRFDLGNISFREEKNAVYRVYLVVENGKIQMRTEDPLPRDDDVLDSLPIDGFIAKGMVPLFRDKFQAIHSRMNQINEARRAAYNMAHNKPALCHEGETLTRLNPLKITQAPTASPSNDVTKREPNQEVTQHVSNKRKRTGLDTIPEDAKCRTFDTISRNVKVDLFNSIMKTAFPNFDNLMVASWNVVSIYSVCGSDFPDLHRAIFELKRVLQDFDDAFRGAVERQAPKTEHDSTGPLSSDGNRGSGGESNGDRHSPVLPVSKNKGNAENSAGQTNSSTANNPSLQPSKEAKKKTPEPFAPKPSPNIPQPVTPLQPPQVGEDSSKEEGETDSESDSIPHQDPRCASNGHYLYPSSASVAPQTKYSPLKRQSTTFASASASASPQIANTSPFPTPSSINNSASLDSLNSLFNSEYSSPVSKPVLCQLLTSTPVQEPPKLRLEMTDANAAAPLVNHSPPRRSNSVQRMPKQQPGSSLGTSILEPKKAPAVVTGGVAPVANMVPSGRRREDRSHLDQARERDRDRYSGSGQYWRERERGERAPRQDGRQIW